MDAPPREKHKQARAPPLQLRTPQLIGRPSQRGGATTFPIALRSVSYREEKAVLRMERYGSRVGEPEKLGRSGDDNATLADGEDDGMDYSDAYDTPTPAQSRAHPEGSRRGGRAAERAAEKLEDGDEEGKSAKDEERSRGRKRLRTSSPEAEQEGQLRTPGKASGVAADEETGDEGHGEERANTPPAIQQQQGAPPQPHALGDPSVATQEALPPHPVLPSAEECERMIEKVVQDAAESLRTKLRELVEQARGRTEQAGPEQPQMSQETRDYWQYYMDPTEALFDLERADGAIPNEWPSLEGSMGQSAASGPRQPIHAFPDIQYESMEVLLAKGALKTTPSVPAQPQLSRDNTAADWDRNASTTLDPRPRMAKGKERQQEHLPIAMEVDRPLARHGAANATAPGQDWSLWGDEEEDRTLPQQTDREMAEERRREELRSKWKTANLADPIAEREASGQPEHRRTVDQKETEMALALHASRVGEIAKLGLAPPLENGNPAVHANSPKDRVRNVPEAKLRDWRGEQAGTYVLLDVYGEGDIEDTDPQRIYDNLQAALKRITGLEKVKLEQPPRTPRTVSKEHAATTWFASGLYPAAVALLVRVHAWPTADITFFAYRETEFIPRYLFAIKGFTQNDQDEVRLAVWEIFREAPIYPSIYNLVKKNPDYIGMDHNRVTDDILSTIEVSIKPVNEEKHARLITHVYMTSPTRSAAMWESWRDGLRYPPKGKALSEDHPHLEVSQRITRCKACHGADHLTTQCQYGHLEGWAKISEGAGSRKTDQWRARTPGLGRGQYSNERITPSDDEGGATGWSNVEPRGKGIRGKTTRGGGGPHRGAQPRSRRGQA
ncbi:hypothetical protein OH77DRAFT_1508694 [Trametes cingulata]|nr:hypothetical protein OH77DRAFT_1508694 [Trametes cingulata]